MKEWEIPRDADDTWPDRGQNEFTRTGVNSASPARSEIDASIAEKADYEYLYDKPYEDKKKVRVAGPFTVETLSPHRLAGCR